MHNSKADHKYKDFCAVLTIKSFPVLFSKCFARGFSTIFIYKNSKTWDLSLKSTIWHPRKQIYRQLRHRFS